MADTQWDTAVHFGRGKHKGGGKFGFHEVTTSIRGQHYRTSVFTGALWRADKRGPDVVFREGFQLHTPGVEVSGRITSDETGISSAGTTRGAISCSGAMIGALTWAANGWLYLAHLAKHAWVAEVKWNASHLPQDTFRPALDAANRQIEYMVRDFPANRIIAGRRVDMTTSGLKFVGDPVINDSYHGRGILSRSDYAIRLFVRPGDIDLTPEMLRQLDQCVP